MISKERRPMTGEVLSGQDMADTAVRDPFRTPLSYKPLHRDHAVATIGTPCSLPHCARPPISMYTYVFPPECDQCVTDCDMASCDADATQCTYQCAVVPCEDPSSCADACQDCTSYDLECDTEGCPFFEDGASDSVLGLACQLNLVEQLRQLPGTSYGAASTYLSPASDSINTYPTLLSWSNFSTAGSEGASLEAVSHAFGSISEDSGLSSSFQSVYPPTQSTSYSQYSYINSSKVSPPGLLSPIPASTESSQSSPSLTSSALTPLHYSTSDVQCGPVDQIGLPTKFLGPPNTSCLWTGCGKQFRSIQELSEHVNSVHLNFRQLLGQNSQSQEMSSHENTGYTGGEFSFSCPESLRCRWADCAMDSLLSFDQSAIETPEAIKEVLLHHVQQSHLGFTVEGTSAPVILPPPLKPVAPDGIIHSSSSIPNEQNATMQESKFHKVDSEERSNGVAYQFCKWQSCSMAGVRFSSAAELTQHISDTHVGTGFSQYHCWWEGCNRNNDHGFSSKQKILRHIQSHTGYRPFKCPECSQFFSEAATLQQHIRRHTKEKPYFCDFPGCGKAFAIAGALTIHKRVHSGSKPFKCQYCDRSFSESSNLSKHVRTHTGDRPYACSYPGCNKRFARPDQVTRHKKMHAKKGKVENDELKAQ